MRKNDEDVDLLLNEYNMNQLNFTEEQKELIRSRQKSWREYLKEKRLERETLVEMIKDSNKSLNIIAKELEFERKKSIKDLVEQLSEIHQFIASIENKLSKYIDSRNYGWGYSQIGTMYLLFIIIILMTVHLIKIW